VRRGAAPLSASLLAAVVWAGCASAPSVRSPVPETTVSRPGSTGKVRRLLDSGVVLQAGGRYAQSQQALSAALSELSLIDTAGASESDRALAQQVLGAMRNNLPYSLEPEIVEDPELSDEEDGVALLDSLSADSTAMVMDSAAAAALRHELLSDSTQTFDLPVEINDLVLMQIRIFRDRVPQHFARWLERKGRWEGFIVQELQAHGMPKDLLYLAMIESGFNPRATSPAAAAGIWQFIPGTGRRFGLRIDRFVDERRDPRKATQAAIAYLSALYQEFGDWRLAAAAYNCGENCVERAIRRAGHNDYWRIPLPRETRNYVPRIFAAAILGKNPKAHGFMVEPWAPVVFDTFTVEGGVTFAQVSQALGVPEDSLALLNPSLIRGTTPPAHESNVLNLPVGSRAKFETAYAGLERSYQAPQPQRYVHRVRRKESLAGIASRYGVSVADIKRWNKIRGRKVRSGRTLVIWGDFPGGAGASLVEPPLAKPGEGTPEPSHQLSHKIRRGETLAAIARRYGVTAQDLKDWNGLGGKRLKSGHRIWVSAPTEAERGVVSQLVKARVDSTAPEGEGDEEPATGDEPSAGSRHRVRAGETLASIARRYGVSSQDLKDWNDLSGRKLRAGRMIRVSAPDQADAPDPAPARRSAVASEPAPTVASTEPFRHRVHAGENLEGIARRYGTTVDRIKQWNGLASDRIRPGAKLWIGGPATDGRESAVAARPAKPIAGPKPPDAPIPPRVAAAGSREGAARVHVVKDGETLEAIAQQYSVAVSSIRILNRIRGSRITVGQKLVIPGAAAPNPPVSGQARKPVENRVRTVRYTVRPGDSLYSIARAQSTSVDSLLRLNGLKEAALRAGQVILIPLASAR